MRIIHKWYFETLKFFLITMLKIKSIPATKNETKNAATFFLFCDKAAASYPENAIPINIENSVRKSAILSGIEKYITKIDITNISKQTMNKDFTMIHIY